jgi:hypothetical protein
MNTIIGAERPGRATGKTIENVRVATPAWMRLYEGAMYGCMSERYLRGLAKSGRIRSARVGNRLVFRKSWIDAYLGE